MGHFIKRTVASIVGTIAGLLIFFTVGMSSLVLLLIVSSSKQENVQVNNKSVLVFDLSTQIKDSKKERNLRQVIGGSVDNSISLRSVLYSLKKAKNDDRIVGLFLDGRRLGSGSGYAIMEEVREAIIDFQKSGKKIIAYDVNWSEREYYLASVADRVILNPMGMLEFNGLSSQQMFLKGALEKYGVGVQVVRVGDYKSAVEPYTRNNLSPENRSQTKALLTDLWVQFLDSVGESRKLSPKYLQEIADTQGFVESKEAEKTGLVDEIAYFDSVNLKFRELTGEYSGNTQSFSQISLKKYAEDPSVKPSYYNTSENKIAVIYAEGSIVGGEGSSEQIGSDRFAKKFRKLRENKNVKAIVLRVNSPGGSATASEIILRELLLTKNKKPVIVSMGNVAASGGYWISTGANHIFAEENTITGSIGVFGLLYNIQKIGNNNGVTWDVVQTGRFADIQSTVRPKTDSELNIYRKSVAQTYNLFLDKVSKHRNLSKSEVDRIAQGRIWSGKEAVKIGLVDKIGGLESAIAYAAKSAQLGSDWQVMEYPQNRGWDIPLFNSLVSNDLIQSWQEQDENNFINTQLSFIKEELEILNSFNDPTGVYARIPFNFNIK